MFKELNRRLVLFKLHCFTELSSAEGGDFGFVDEESTNAFETRNAIFKITISNSLYLNEKSRKAIENFLAELSILMNLELYIAGGTIDKEINLIDVYDSFSKKAEIVLETLHKNLNV